MICDKGDSQSRAAWSTGLLIMALAATANAMMTYL
jgi:hypothetical protein